MFTQQASHNIPELPLSLLATLTLTPNWPSSPLINARLSPSPMISPLLPHPLALSLMRTLTNSLLMTLVNPHPSLSLTRVARAPVLSTHKPHTPVFLFYHLWYGPFTMAHSSHPISDRKLWQPSYFPYKSSVAPPLPFLLILYSWVESVMNKTDKNRCPTK
jgi:hypothetical protein